MRAWLNRPLVMLAVLSSTCFAPPHAHADSPYEAFRIPESHRSELQLGFSSNLGWFQTADPSSESEFRNRLGFLGVSALRADESETRRHVLSLQLRPGWSSLQRESHSEGSLSRRDEWETSDQDRYAGTFSILEDWYGADSRWGVETFWSGTYQYMRDGNSDADTQSTATSTFRSQSSATRHTYDLNGIAQISVGRGRIRDVSAVLYSLALEDRLNRMGALVQPLNDAVRQQLAQLYSVRADLQAAHTRSQRVFWREVSRILHDAGALKSEWLEGEAFARTQEEISPFPRFPLHHGARLELLSEFGWLGGHSDYDVEFYSQNRSGGLVIDEFSSRSSSRDRHELRRARFGLGGSIAGAQGNTIAWQVSSAALYGDGPARSIELLSGLSVQRLLLDRWYMSASLLHDVISETRDDQRLEPTWLLASHAQLSYLVEDHWSVDLGFSRSVSQFRGSPTALAVFGPREDRATSLQLGLTWRPSGRFDSPTLGISERPMAMTR